MFLLVDKPKGITSHDVIDKLRRVTGERRIGHAGTLDPNATGLLIVGIGRESTKKLGVLTTGTSKTYKAEIILGETRDTDDAEGEITSKNQAIRKLSDENLPAQAGIKNVLKGFEGEQMQMPPVFSAIKLKGKKAYDLARKGQSPKLEPRKVVIHSIKLDKYEYPKLEITCEVSAGTYIRSIARDLGKNLETGGYLENLRRTKVGQFNIEDAEKLEDINSDNWRNLAIEI